MVNHADETGTSGYQALLARLENASGELATKKFILRSPPAFGTNQKLGNLEKIESYGSANLKIMRIRDELRDLIAGPTGAKLVTAGVLRYVDGTTYGLDPQQKMRTKCPIFTGSVEICQCHWLDEAGVRAVNYQFLNTLATMQTC